MSAPRLDVFLVGPPYGGGSCPDQADFGDGEWYCDAWVSVGGIVGSEGHCLD